MLSYIFRAFSHTPAQLLWKTQFIASLTGPLPRRIKPQLLENELEEVFVKGGGKGGQKVNKTNNCVRLTHIPTGFNVKVHSSRDRETNRNLARKRISQQLDELINGKESKSAQKEEKIKRKKARTKRKQQAALKLEEEKEEQQ